jgi:hypothetical protein
VHSTAHHHVAAGYLVEEDVLSEWREHDEKMPVAQTRMSEPAGRSKVWVFSKHSASGFQGVEVVFRDLPASVGHIPLELPLNVGDEIVRLAQTHEARL